MGDWNEEDHPRDERGRFGSLGAWAARRLAGPLAAKASAGGFSYRPGAPKGDRVPKEGVMVSRAPDEGHGQVVDVKAHAEEIASRGLSREQAHAALDEKVRSAVETWLRRALPALDRLGPDHYLGGYVEKDDQGRTVALHFDVSQRFKTKDMEKALQAGRDRNQISVWHVEEQREIPTGGTGR